MCAFMEEFSGRGIEPTQVFLEPDPVYVARGTSGVRHLFAVVADSVVIEIRMQFAHYCRPFTRSRYGREFQHLYIPSECLAIIVVSVTGSVVWHKHLSFRDPGPDAPASAVASTFKRNSAESGEIGGKKNRGIV